MIECFTQPLPSQALMWKQKKKTKKTMDSVTVDDGFYCSGLQNCIVGEQIWKECKDNASHRLNTRNEHLFPVFNVQR